MTPREEIEKAARDMRARAKAATGAGSTTRWKRMASASAYGVVTVGAVRIATTDERIAQDDHNAEHIAHADPTVMLAVADWLQSCAESYHPGFLTLRHPQALAVARAYNREQQP